MAGTSPISYLLARYSSAELIALSRFVNNFRSEKRDNEMCMLINLFARLHSVKLKPLSDVFAFLFSSKSGVSCVAIKLCYCVCTFWCQVALGYNVIHTCIFSEWYRL